MLTFQEILNEVKINFPNSDEKYQLIRARENYIFQNYDKRNKKHNSKNSL